MDRRTPYERAPIRMKCVATASRRVARDYEFGDTVRATWSTVEMRALTDGKDVFTLALKEGIASKVVLDNTYMFKRLILKGGRAYYNDDTSAFKSYSMEVDPQLVEQGKALLCPPSSEVESYETLMNSQGYLTIKAKVEKVADVKQVSLKGTALPIRDLEVSFAGHPVAITLWREVSLEDISEGHWMITHLRPTKNSFGFKLSSSVYTEIHQIQSAHSARECTIVAVSAGTDCFTLLMGNGTELKVPTQSWVGTEEDFLCRLPLTVTLAIQGDVIVSTDKLFETAAEESVDEEDIGDLDVDLLLNP